MAYIVPRQADHKIMLLGCPNTFNAVRRAEAFQEVVQGVPAVSPVAVKC